MARFQEPAEYAVWPENWSTVEAFLLVQTQWRQAWITTLADVVRVVHGLDYGAVEAGLRMAGITPTPEIFRGLQVMEAAAMEELNRP